ncbi:MAG: hypothetical protein JXA42_13285 [Anaerolineales bacterium]|nr:hypothetical protein [Anaerolineales bacterium]
MKRTCFFSILLLFLSVLLAGCKEETNEKPELDRSMKGYELYSWQDGEQWCFSLLMGTNRIKTYDEVTSLDVRIQGVDALLEELDRLPRGESLFWTSGLVPGTRLPSDDIIAAVKETCQEGGIQLEISNWAGKDSSGIIVKPGQPLPSAAPAIAPPQPLPTHMLIPLLPPDSKCDTADYPVNMVWASHPLEVLSMEVQTAMVEAGLPDVIVRAEAFGEDWYEYD